ncbi:MAG: endonuclease/exonuclease/phosphatase family protein [Cyclobacteriaceae bacterium]|nr:endonuclease/exonuclease/phosphatase family protein [Cyclobacteriaceae bacterium]
MIYRMGQLLKSIPLIVLIFTLICYSSALIPPEKFWPAGLLIYGILPMVIINLILFILLAVLRKLSIVWPLIALLTGIPFINITFSYDFNPEINQNKKVIEVMSLNARNLVSGPEIIDWIREDTSEIKCIQEYYSNSRNPVRNVTEKMAEMGYETYLLSTTFSNGYEYSGLATFSRYPIIGRGALLFNENSGNNCIYTDLKIDEDTLRIYNVHLSSMRINFSTYRDPDDYDSKMKGLASKLKNGAIRRSDEIDKLLKHTSECPYPLIICGDYNDIPYSYNYFKLRRHFTNAFEEAGHGFGFSFRNRFIFFLRIDHHFIHGKIIPVLYRVDHNMKHSDHFPTRGFYQLP